MKFFKVLVVCFFAFFIVAESAAKEDIKGTPIAAPGKEEITGTQALTYAPAKKGFNLGDWIRYGKIGEGIKIGDTRWVIHPKYEQRGTFDSNIFLDPTNQHPKSDYFFDMIPGVEIEMPFSKHMLTAGYMADISQYCKFTSQNAADQNAYTHLNLDFDRYYFRQNNVFNDTTARSGTEFTSKVERRNWTFDGTAGAIYNKFTFESGFSYFFERYVPTAYQDLDRKEYVLTSSAFYRIFPKTDLLVEGNTGFVRYDTINGTFRDNNYWQGRGGLRGQILPKVEGVAKFGYMGKDYQRADVPDFHGFVAYVGAVWQYSEKTLFTVSYARTPLESTFGDNNFYLSDTVSLRWDQKLINKLAAYFSLQYQQARYPRETVILDQKQKRDDAYWTFDTGLNYDIQSWLVAGVGYEYANRASNFSNWYDYDRHQMFWRLAATF